MHDTIENVFKSRRFKLFGVFDTQPIIKGVFGFYASIAIFALILICLFLLKEAWAFPGLHYEGLSTYRKTGQEFAGYVMKEYKAFEDFSGPIRRAYSLEVAAKAEPEDDQIRVFNGLVIYVQEQAKAEVRHLNAALEQKAAATPEQMAAINQKIADRRAELRKASEKIFRWTNRDTLDFKTKVSQKRFQELKALALTIQPGQDETPQEIQDLMAESAKKKAEARKEYAALGALVDRIEEAGVPLEELQDELKEAAENNATAAMEAHNAGLNRESKLKEANETQDATLAAQLRAEADAIEIPVVNLKELSAVFYEKKPIHQTTVDALRAEAEAVVKGLPRKANDPNANKALKEAKSEYRALLGTLKTHEKKIQDWEQDKRYSWIGAFFQFLAGREWITGGSWHDFYGVLPLVCGSFLISMVAVIVAVPFSLGAAIYVNQLSTRKEQDFIKPCIEFIQAIPSVVLGFFGIMVLGTWLREVSQSDWLAWIPGFPMQERLNILNAGLLLAFMAVPTIFTLCEDALNNVPESYTQASLAVGASKMQTVLGVVVPSALSGIFAAVLLGFGRIIGETMVVLLVAGNKIAMPDLSLGLGVVTQPSHTMTGIVAQEMGEVGNGSEHWAALFMIGMLLFLISLIINVSAQQILKKFSRRAA